MHKILLNLFILIVFTLSITELVFEKPLETADFDFTEESVVVEKTSPTKLVSTDKQEQSLPMFSPSDEDLVSSEITRAPLLSEKQEGSSVIEMQKEPELEWSEAESFLLRLEYKDFDLDTTDAYQFNSVIQEIKRITYGLPEAEQQAFKNRLYQIIKDNGELTPLPEDELAELEN